MTKDDEIPADVRMAAEAAERRYRSASPVSISLHSIIIDAIMADRARRAHDAAMPVVKFRYRNWRGVTAERHVIGPFRLWFGSTEWHPEPQLLLSAFDTDKQANRDFAVADINPHIPPSQDLREVREALAWYAEKARLARLIHSEGDSGRHELAADGGNRARAALSRLGGSNDASS